jgi:hypothetical protein
MNEIRDIDFFIRLLQDDPTLPCPSLPRDVSTFEQLQEWKSAIRSYDRARIHLGIKTPAQVNEENSAIGPNRQLTFSWEGYVNARRTNRIYA